MNDTRTPTLQPAPVAQRAAALETVLTKHGVLPKGFVKVRSYGLWSARSLEKLQKARNLLAPPKPISPTPDEAGLHAGSGPQPSILNPPPQSSEATADQPQLCPHCKTGHLLWVRELLPQRTRGP